ncbi:hypothetical protein C8J57DRAFT_1013825, partial [Mycena rebaudengoi]
MAAGLCLNCELEGHFARNCPTRTNVPSHQKGKPPGFGVHGVNIHEINEAEFDDSDMPELQSVSDSEDEDAPVLRPLPGDENETLDDRLCGLRERLSELELDGSPRPFRDHALGDLLAQGATALLEFLQPYPGDERVRKAFRDADEPQFSVVPISETEYSIYDGFYDELVNLPTYLLRNPSFRLADWFAKKRAADLGL